MHKPQNLQDELAAVGHIPFNAAATFARLDARDAEIARDKELTARAWAIVNAELPQLPPAHGFYDPDGFVARSIRGGHRFARFKEVKACLKAGGSVGEAA